MSERPQTLDCYDTSPDVVPVDRIWSVPCIDLRTGTASRQGHPGAFGGHLPITPTLQPEASKYTNTLCVVGHKALFSV